MIGERLVEIIDFEKYRVAIGFELAEVVLFVRVVGVTKVVVHGDRLDDPVNSLLAQPCDPRRHNCGAGRKVLAKVVIEYANLFGLAGHGLSRLIGVTEEECRRDGSGGPGSPLSEGSQAKVVGALR